MNSLLSAYNSDSDTDTEVKPAPAPVNKFALAASTFKSLANKRPEVVLKEEDEPKQEPRKKVKIFVNLPSDNIVEDVAAAKEPARSSKGGLFAMLPAPKEGGRSVGLGLGMGSDGTNSRILLPKATTTPRVGARNEGVLEQPSSSLRKNEEITETQEENEEDCFFSFGNLL
jgi:hypothetical protein